MGSLSAVGKHGCGAGGQVWDLVSRRPPTAGSLSWGDSGCASQNLTASAVIVGAGDKPFKEGGGDYAPSSGRLTQGIVAVRPLRGLALRSTSLAAQGGEAARMRTIIRLPAVGSYLMSSKKPGLLGAGERARLVKTAVVVSTVSQCGHRIDS